jgi:hypothetical protein
MEPLQQNIHDFVVNGLTNGPENMNRGEILPDSTWQHIRRIGTRLWLDTGDIGAARELWDPDRTEKKKGSADES